jgi:hypothetical protein
VRCYQYFDISLDWNTASTTCNSNSNGLLVTIHNEEEYNYLYDNSFQSSSYWIGYTDVAVEGTFVWDYIYYKALDEGTSEFTGTTYGDASKSNGHVTLTTNDFDKNGQIEYTGIYPGNRMYATFDTWTGGGNGADAIFFYWGATTRPADENSNSGAYLFAIDEYQNELQLNWNGIRIHTKVVDNIDDSIWHSWVVECINNAISVWRDGVLQFTKIDSARTLSTNSNIGWGGRTGGAYNRHLVRNMKIWVSSENGTGIYSNTSEDCTYIKNGFLWNDILCSQLKPFICETVNNICPSGSYSLSGSSSW